MKTALVVPDGVGIRNFILGGAIDRLRALRLNPAAARKNASGFSRAAFRENLLGALRSLLTDLGRRDLGDNLPAMTAKSER